MSFGPGLVQDRFLNGCINIPPELDDVGMEKDTAPSRRFVDVLRPAFQMAVDDDILNKNPFGFELAGVVVNDSITREAISREQMRQFLKFLKDDNVYCKYYEAVYILFHTGLRISEFCGLTLSDLDMENRIINVDHQLQRGPHMELYLEATKTSAGTRMLPMTEEVYECFRAIIEERGTPRHEVMISGVPVSFS